MKTISRKEIETLISNIENESLKNKIEKFLEFDEVDIDTFFKKVKELDMIDDTDYKLMLLLEEFYLRLQQN